MTTSALAARPVSVTLFPRTCGGDEPTVDMEIPVALPKREHGLGYYVRRADTGQDLGMVSKAADGWRAYLLNGAYYPADADLLTRTNHHRSHRGETWATGELVCTADTRADAVHTILFELARRWAAGLEDLVAIARAPFLATRPDLAR